MYADHTKTIFIFFFPFFCPTHLDSIRINGHATEIVVERILNEVTYKSKNAHCRKRVLLIQSAIFG